MMAESGLNLHTIEVAIGLRERCSRHLVLDG